MRLHEEFERCKECDGGWFKIEDQALVVKGSDPHSPVHHKEVKLYICVQCGHVQYIKKEAGG